MACVEKLTCPKCGGDNLQVFEKDGSFTGYCFGINKRNGKPCRTYYADPYGDSPRPAVNARTVRSPEEVQEDLAYVSALPEASLGHRKLLPWSLAHYGVRMEVSEQDGSSPTMAFYPYYRGNELVAYKAKHIEPKKLWVLGDFDDVDMFGWRQALDSGASKLVICTGEEDVVATYQAMVDSQRGGKWESLQPAVVSLTAGDGSVRRCLTKVLSTIKSHFKEVIFCFDQDASGQAAIKEGLQIIPTARAVILPCKDANACVMEGRNRALVDAVLWKSATPKNSRIIDAQTLFSEAKKAAEPGLSWPWQGLTDLTKGMRFSEVSYWGAGQKAGKSELVNSLTAHWITQHGLKCFLAKPEEANNKTVKMVLGKIAHKKFDDPDVFFDEEAYDKAASQVGDKLQLLDLYQHVDFSTFKQDIIAAAADGCKIIVLDPLTSFVGGLSNAEANTHLQDIAQELAAIAKDHSVHIHVFCHLRNPDQGPGHERGGKVLSSQFAGSRGMARHCHMLLGLEANRDPELPIEERNMRKLVLLEDRAYGSVGSIDLYWDQATAVFNEVKNV